MTSTTQWLHEQYEAYVELVDIEPDVVFLSEDVVDEIMLDDDIEKDFDKDSGDAVIFGMTIKVTTSPNTINFSHDA